MNRTLDQLAEAIYSTPQASAATPADSAPQPQGTRTEAELAEAIYGKPAAPAQPAESATTAPVKQRTQDELADAVYGKEAEDTSLDPVSEDVAALRDDPARRMYSAQTAYRDTLPDSLFADEGSDLKLVQKGAREIREMAADLSLGANEIRIIKDRVAHVKIAKPDADAQHQAAADALTREYGDDAPQALRDARALLQRDPRVAKIIEGMGVSHDPEVLLVIARAARSQRATGKLK